MGVTAEPLQLKRPSNITFVESGMFSLKEAVSVFMEYGYVLTEIRPANFWEKFFYRGRKRFVAKMELK